jgi:phospholipase C
MGTYTVEPGKSLSDTWLFGSLGVAGCALSVYGPNGFFRGFGGSVSGLRKAQLHVCAGYDGEKCGIDLRIANPSSQTANVSILDQYTDKSVKFTIGAGQTESRYFSLSHFGGWYDLVITVASDASIKYHFAGHAENGKDSISDPALGGLLGPQQTAADRSADFVSVGPPVPVVGAET